MSQDNNAAAAIAVPAAAKKWNWGAFFMTWIWGLGNKTYIALLGLIPVVNIVMAFVLGARGSGWAWKNKKWEAEALLEFKTAWDVYVPGRSERK